MANVKENAIIVLEDLPNELFRQIFFYLSGVDAVFAFSLLNTRFQCLLKEYCQGFDFQLINKTKFDIIFDQYDKQWWKSLRLSNEDTPGQIEYFFQCYSLIDENSQLKFLSLSKIESINKSILLSQISFLINLVSLTLKPICGRILSNINLPKLKRLVVTSCQDTEWIRDWSQLESVEYEITTCCSELRTNLIWPRQLKYLKIIFKSDEESLLVLQSLTHLSQLITLEIYQKELGRLSTDGQVWEYLIRSSFPLMKIFKFYFPFNYSYISVIEIETIMSSYSSSFYIDEKKWFIRCDVFANYGQGAIYSLPFAFDQFILFNDFYESKILTLSNNNSKKNLYQKVKIFLVESLPYWNIDYKSSTMYRKSILSLIRNNYFNSIERFHFLPNTRLDRQQHHIEVLSNNLFSLIKKMPRLYSLDIRMSDLQIVTNNFNDRLICDHLSEKIRSLKLHQNGEMKTKYLSEHELNQIIRIFGANCQHLSISISSSIDTILVLFQNMQQLHSLHLIIETKSNAEMIKNWLLKQQIGLSLANCFIFNLYYNYYFWLTRE